MKTILNILNALIFQFLFIRIELRKTTLEKHSHSFKKQLIELGVKPSDSYPKYRLVLLYWIVPCTGWGKEGGARRGVGQIKFINLTNWI